MFLKKRKSFSIRKNSKKNVVLLTVAVFMVYSFISNVSVDAPPRADDQLALRREIVTHNLGVAPPDGQSRNVSSLPEVTKEPVDKHGCEKWFENSFEENLKHISRYPRGVADTYMSQITGNLTKPKTIVSYFPVIATAADSGFYGVTQGLLKSIYEIVLPKYKNIKVIYYDMGLTQHQRLQLQKHCNICEVRHFPFEDLPGFMRKLKTYAWKPVIVKTLLMEFGWVWWMDSSVRFITSDLDLALNYSRDNSVLFFTYGVVFAVAQHTSVQTMQFLGEDRCKFRHFGEVEATFVLFHFDRVTDIVIDRWASCALNEDCIAPAGTEHKLTCNTNNKKDGRCHRFDQAVLSILLRRLYHEKNNYPLVTNPFHIHTIRRGQFVSYFPE